MASTQDMGGNDTPNRDANQLVLEHIELVSQLVQQMAASYPRHVDRGELWSAGVLGLVEASRRFDPAMGISFPRYAAIRIRGAIIDSTRSRDWASRRVRWQVRELETAEATMRAQGAVPTEEDLARLLGCSVDRVRELRAQAQSAALLSLEWTADDDGEALANRIEETNTADLPEESLEEDELMGTISTAIRHLPLIQREVIERYYLKEEMLADIAADLGVTVARTSQIRSEAINAIRAYLANLYQGVPEVPQGAPGHQMRAQYLADLAAHSTWRTRLEAGTRAARAVS
jgi:RNA polymerase sigma factor for flagellar operon FliA